MLKFFAEKMWEATHIFSAKNIRILYIESAKTVNEMTLNELVKLTTLWTTGSWTSKTQIMHFIGIVSSHHSQWHKMKVTKVVLIIKMAENSQAYSVRISTQRRLWSNCAYVHIFRQFYKGDIFSDFLWTSKKRGLFLKEIICSQVEQIISFYIRPLF